MPQAKCSACGRYISQADGVSCSTCPLSYHQSCLGKGKDSRIGRDWSCPECTKNKPRKNGSDTPVKGDTEPRTAKQSSNSLEQSGFDLAHEVRLFREELHALRDEVKMMREDMREMRVTMSLNNSRLDSIEERVGALEQSVTQKTGGAARFENIIAQLRLELDQKEQEMLVNDIEITNLPEMQAENPTHLVTIIGTKLGMTLDERDIVSAERVGPRYPRGAYASTESGDTAARGGRPRPLVVRFARRAHRDDMLRNMRVRRGANAADFGMPGDARPFYINERLTKTNRQLLHKVREARKRLQWKFLWVKRGRIFVKQDEGKMSYHIQTENDITRVFGSDTVTLP
ncbi:unnamed protein product [Arctia plantaginis]|uniref:PHD-type domain-containing protein n=1 Tax=Arctia plantaginis TaxID=874455 RepID=A0A8S1A9K4_ARCPL|nr:unnamed protein product [Arctia plantaginis]CAB3251251.1 unnamed protein product [Arctia plantaginis]